MLRFALYIGFIIFPGIVQAQHSKNVTLLGNWNDASIVATPDGAVYNEVWGFLMHGEEYGVIGSTMGTHIIRIMPDHSMYEAAFVQGGSNGPAVVNRDFFEYKGYLYSTCDQGNGTTLQIIDLHYLPDSVEVVYDDDTLFGRAHTVWVDTATAKLYVCAPAGFAMKVFDVTDPVNPVLLYTHTAQAYIHDCYVRNDTAFLNAANEGLFVYDFTNTASPFLIGNLTGYIDQGYNHSGKWSTDGNWYVFADETPGARIKLCDASDLTDIQVHAVFTTNSDATTVAHDPVFKGQYVYVAYYYDGFVVFDISDPSAPFIAGYYDTYTDLSVLFKGAWGVYAELPSGRILVSDRQTGLYLFNFIPEVPIESELAHTVFPNPLYGEGNFYFEGNATYYYDFDVYDSKGSICYQVKNHLGNVISLHADNFDAGIYYYHLQGADNTAQAKGKFVVVR